MVPLRIKMIHRKLNHFIWLKNAGFVKSFLHHSAHFETSTVAEFLVEAGDIDAIDHQSGTTALGLAAWSGRLPVVNLLLEAGANPLLPADEKWARPLSFAKEQGHEEVVKRLEAVN